MANRSAAESGPVDRRGGLQAAAALAAPGPALMRQGHAAARPPVVIGAKVPACAANTPERPWHNVPNWPAHLSGDEIVAAMDKVGVGGPQAVEPVAAQPEYSSWSTSRS
jgi:hypothetical protein